MLFDVCMADDGQGGVAVWQITESEDTLLDLLRQTVHPGVWPSVTAGLEPLHNPARRCEWLAVRVLVARFLGAGKVIAYHPSGAPRLTDGSTFISISHTKGYAALAWHGTHAIGVDIEQRTDRVMRVVSRFVNADEQCALTTFGIPSPDGELLLWTAKEALYKLVGIRELDCQYGLTVDIAAPIAAEGQLKARCTDTEREYSLTYRFTSDFVLTLAQGDD